MCQTRNIQYLLLLFLFKTRIFLWGNSTNHYCMDLLLWTFPLTQLTVSEDNGNTRMSKVSKALVFYVTLGSCWLRCLMTHGRLILPNVLPTTCGLKRVQNLPQKVWFHLQRNYQHNMNFYTQRSWRLSCSWDLFFFYSKRQSGISKQHLLLWIHQHFSASFQHLLTGQINWSIVSPCYNHIKRIKAGLNFLSKEETMA